MVCTKPTALSKKKKKTASALLAEPGNERMKLFIEKKVLEMSPTDPKVARRWCLQLYMGWCGKRIFNRIKMSERKMEIVWRRFKLSFVGYGTNVSPDEEAIEIFRDMVTEELKAVEQKAKLARKKYVETKSKSERPPTPPPQVQEDTSQLDNFSLEAIKLQNEHTVNKNIDVARSYGSTLAEPTVRVKEMVHVKTEPLPPTKPLKPV